MKQVSEEYQTQMAQTYRNRSYVRVVVDDENDEAKEAASISFSTAYFPITEERILSDASYGPTTITTEWNRWLLDGNENQRFAEADSTSVANGYVTDGYSESAGTYSGEQIVCLLLPSFTLTGFTVVFDTRLNTWPSRVRFRFYNSGTLVKEEVAEGLTSPRAAVGGPITCSRVEVTALSGQPYTRFRVERLILGVERVFENADITNTAQAHDVDPLSRRLPSEEVEVTLLDFDAQFNPDNPQGVWAYMSEHAPISIQHGYDLVDADGNTEIYWLSPDRYVLTSRPTASRNLAVFKGTGLLGSMTGTYYKCPAGSKTLYALAQNVLADANLPVMPDGSQPWVIDQSLQQMVTTGILPIDTHATCLQIIAHAACCKIRTDEDNRIHIEPFDLSETQTVQPLTFDTILEESQVISRIAELGTVRTSVYSVTPQTEAVTIFEGTTTETNLHMTLEQPYTDITAFVDGMQVTPGGVYARAIDLTMAAGEKYLVIRGKPLSVTRTVTSRVVKAGGADDEEDNPLVTSQEMATRLTTHVVNYLSLRTTIEQDYRGNPELETGDRVALQTRFAGNVPGIVLTNRLTFNGALRGSVMVKGVGE